MKITIDIDDNVKETEINIKCNKLTSEVENLIATLRIINQQMLVIKDNENYLLDVNKISYIEAIERKLRLTMKNDEQIIVSRQYADEIKKKLGVM